MKYFIFVNLVFLIGISINACNKPKTDSAKNVIDIESAKNVIDIEKEKKEIEQKIKELLRCETTTCIYFETTCGCESLGDFTISVILNSELNSKLLAGYVCLELKSNKHILTKTDDNGKTVSNNELSELDRRKMELKIAQIYLQGLQKGTISESVLSSIHGCQSQELRLGTFDFSITLD